MNEHDVLLDDIFPFLKKNYRILGTAGIIIGTVLVIIYGSKINYYPSGMTISDTLFFLWVLIVAGFIYSIVFYIFFHASLFWIVFLPEPIDCIVKKISKNKIRVPEINNRLWLIVEGTLLNILILLYFALNRSIGLFVVLFAIYFVIIVCYTCLVVLLKKGEHNIIILREKKENISQQKISPSTGRLFFLFLIYFSPLLVGNFYFTDGITNKTFQMMGVRITGADVAVDRKFFQESLNQLKKEKLAKDTDKCNGDICLFENCTILFTGIGSKTKLEIKGPAGSADIIVPNTAVKLIVKRKFNKAQT